MNCQGIAKTWIIVALLAVVVPAAVGCGDSGGSTPDYTSEDGEVRDEGGEGGDVDGDARDGEIGPDCGNSRVDPGEDCDDGNALPGDGCEADCSFTCTAADDTCPPEQHCVDTTHTCQPGCRADAGCTEPTPYCDTTAHECVACVTTDQCGTGMVCIDGACQTGCEDSSTCPLGQDCCASACVDTDTTLSHCGACNDPCTAAHGTPACVAGVCTVDSCDTGWADCTGGVTDGCETATATDLLNCGSCANACPTRANATISCTGGSCGFACDTGFGDCDLDPLTGCEVDFDTDASHCGNCTTACVSTHGAPACSGGLCATGSCDTGWGDCDGDATNGCETETATDLAHCGSCTNACTTPAHGTAACTTGVCGIGACDAGWTDCDASVTTGCEVDTQNTPTNCGTCGNVCVVPNATAGCALGLCNIASCNAGYADCNRTLVDGCEVSTNTDVANCGTCGSACAAPAHATAGCAGGTCGVGGCSAGWGNCDGVGTNGCEVDLTTAVANCGTCGNVCATPIHAAAACAGGACGMGACDASWGECDGDVVTGCETSLYTIINCGSCGTTCNFTNGTPSCPAGTCQITCNANFGNCDGNAGNGCETDLRTDNVNCGTCGTVCVGGRVCVGSSCIFAAPANDTRAGAITISMANPATTLTTNTTSATNNTSGICGCTATGNDVFYTFTLAASELIYADTVGSGWDTSLFLQNSAGFNLTVAGVPGGTVCSDNGGVGCTMATQSMILAMLPAGTYYLVLSGCNSGAATIHFQHLPVGNGTVTEVNENTATVQTLAGATAGTGVVSSGCGGAGPENTYWFVTCPTFTAQTLASSTCGSAIDTVIDERTAARSPVSQCNDDNCGWQSSLNASLPAGAGLHTLYADSYYVAGGAYTLYLLFGGCGAGQGLCGNTCRNWQTDVANCGYCGWVCAVPPHAAAACTTGVCGLGACAAGWGNCDGNAINGCETDLTSNNANCGACGNVCGAGTSCVASMCRPVNDRCTAATPINLALGSSITLTTGTANAYHDLTSSCGATGTSPDVFFSFTLTRRELVYADTFGFTWDTVLFFANNCATVTPAGTTPGDLVCDDDSGGGACTTGGLQSRVVARFNPGTYYLVLSGFGGAGGPGTIHFHHLPIGNGPLAQLAAGVSTPGGTTAGAGAMTGTCGGGGPENSYWWVTCPETVAGAFSGSTCTRATWDTILYVTNAVGIGNACNDDACPFQSTVASTIPAGAGLHTLTVDGFDAASAGAYTVAVTRP